MNSSVYWSPDAFCTVTRYFGSYFSGLTFTSHSRKIAQRIRSVALRSLLPFRKSAIPWSLSHCHIVTDVFTEPLAFGVIVPTNTCGAVAHDTAGPPGLWPIPPSHRTLLSTFV